MGRDTSHVERTLISSGSPYEPVVGFSRAVRVGEHVYVAGTAPVMPDGADPPEDSYGQARRCFEIIGAALEQAGASFADVVRTRVYLVSADDFDEFARGNFSLYQIAVGLVFDIAADFFTLFQIGGNNHFGF